MLDPFLFKKVKKKPKKRQKASAVKNKPQLDFPLCLAAHSHQ